MAERSKGIIGHLWDRVKAIPTEVASTVTDKVIPQGSAELSQALFTGNGYVPYGPGQSPLAVEDGAKDHAAMLDAYAARGKGQERQLDQGMER